MKRPLTICHGFPIFTSQRRVVLVSMNGSFHMAMGCCGVFGKRKQVVLLTKFYDENHGIVVIFVCSLKFVTPLFNLVFPQAGTTGVVR